jgi:hypothetical protein
VRISDVTAGPKQMLGGARGAKTLEANELARPKTVAPGATRMRRHRLDETNERSVPGVPTTAQIRSLPGRERAPSGVSAPVSGALAHRLGAELLARCSRSGAGSCPPAGLAR